MKHAIIFFNTLALAALLISGCGKMDDMNENPYALKEAPSESYCQPILFKTEYNLASIYRSTTAHLVQHAVSTNSEATSRIVANYMIAEATDDDTWTSMYIQYGNATSMYTRACQENNMATRGVARILQAMTMSIITDVYGNVPCTEAGLLAMDSGSKKYTTKYDSQEDIYRNIVKWFEEANDCLGDPAAVNFNPICDGTFEGNIDKWRRFGNALYLRTLMRISNKVIEDHNGIFTYDVENDLSINVPDKVAELYSSFISGAGSYPMMKSGDNCARVYFNKYNETTQTPFYSTTGGIWNQVAACETMARRMLDGTDKVDDNGQTYYAFKDVSAGGHQPDPRWDCFWRKTLGAPTQLLHIDMQKFINTHISSLGNSQIGRMPNGDNNSMITGEIYDLKNAKFYSLMNYSEQLFLFAEAGARGYIASASGIGTYLNLFKQGITQSILEWNPNVTEDSEEVVAYVNYVANGEKFSGKTFCSDNAVEAILTQKWISLFFVGTEAWNEYRRTGYPLLKTNGPAAENNNTVPTRLRYPADEAYRNEKYFKEAVDGWLRGSNNMLTNVWWADTAESIITRALGRM